MNCICWNARGLSNARAFAELCRLVKDHHPYILFVCETKVAGHRCPGWKGKLGFKGHFVVDNQGKSGGLMMFWKDSVDITMKSYSRGHIDCGVLDQRKQWRFTGFYGNPDARFRRFSWEFIRKLSDSDEEFGLPWVVRGDFNEVCLLSEKKEGAPRSFSQMKDFKDTLEETGIRDIHNE
ncbi:hypothetical protein DH2020_010840 [Rehmannia glutinosa]|uniref:Endonuclease/exonuclease/phosphatase domain-containing protein n=1 Tax=Rehmannia glutinosa TaxID=99300 RepID=A0ABR0XBS9_REHGL